MSIKKLIILILIVILTIIMVLSCKPKEPAKPEGGAEAAQALLRNSAREDRNGWVFVHCEGTPRQVGFQHGWHLAAEIDDLLRAASFYLENSTKRAWAFYREAAERMFWPKLDREYQQEIEGIAEGLRARRPELAYDRIDLTALNGWIELAWYYVPVLEEKAKAGRAGSGEKKAPPYCSAFVATGSYTKDGQIVVAHNAWVEYLMGERWNVVLDLKLQSGNRILMDAMPGFIHSGDDFVLNGAGIVYTETTISQFKGFKEDGLPEFVRARKAAQYAASIDDFVRIMTADGNGAYANDWLVGDLKTNEIARLELGLKNHRVWRTKDGYYVGANFPLDEKVIAEETTFDPKNTAQSVMARKARWEELMEKNKGTIDAEKAMAFLADHVDAATAAAGSNSNVLCGHVDDDPKGLPEFGWAPYYPGGSVQGKATTAALAAELKLWGRMGHPCGQDFIAADYLARRPEFAWQKPFLRDMKANPWTLFEATK
jgi:hypothetical protein